MGETMKRSEINELVRAATACFESHGWALPPKPRWDVTDFGLGDWRRNGLVLVNLADEPEYCEKLMYARRGMTTPQHTHRKKKEDIVCRWGVLRLTLSMRGRDRFDVQVNGETRPFASGSEIELQAGERITLTPGIYHEFTPASEECIIGEVSTANDDQNDNLFTDPNIGRFPQIEEDEPPVIKLISEE